MDLQKWIAARIAALPEDAFDSLDDWPENADVFDRNLPGAFTTLLEPVPLTLEYRSADGEVTERRVTALQLRGTAEGPFHLIARCHTRKAQRTFRADRILSLSGISDLPPDAAPIDLLQGLAEFAVETEWHERQGADRPPQAKQSMAATPFDTIRKRFRAELRLLAFLAKSDADLHPAELDAINAYCEHLAGTAHLSWTKPDCAALIKYCRNLQFSRKVEAACLKNVQRSEPDRAALFHRAAIAVMEADGRHAPEELLMLQAWGAQPPGPSTPDNDRSNVSTTPPSPAPKRRLISAPDDWLFQLILKHFKSEIRLLTFLAKADGALHPAEFEAINTYCSAIAAAQAHARWGAVDRTALEAFCGRTQFTSQSEQHSLDNLQNWDEDLARKFDAAAWAVAAAHGPRSAVEMRMMLNWRSRAPAGCPVLEGLPITPGASTGDASYNPFVLTVGLIALFTSIVIVVSIVS